MGLTLYDFRKRRYNAIFNPYAHSRDQVYMVL